MKPILYLVIPCYNEEKVLVKTKDIFLNKINELITADKIHKNSRILFVNDGSRDDTWKIISDLSNENEHFVGVSLSRNRGHQNALLAGLEEAKNYADIIISIDCDGQDDINAVNEMVEAFFDGADIVYGVRSNRKSDTLFKRATAQGFYKILNLMGGEIVYNHADYRLMSKRAVEELLKFQEVNVFLRGMIPLVGFKSTCVYYERGGRIAGETHYPLKKMLTLAFDGITSFSIKPIRIISAFGFLVSIIGFLLILWSIICRLTGNSVSGWASTLSVISFFGGIQLLSIGVIGEYIGKIYMEVKKRPRYIIEDRTYKEK
ncbi:MAG: glycosyltransferase family 2 protein [Ruminococcaceae bacterium]|nr:glycosyltransferase family 2 protein [Oscillospiraceae bacterium]